MYGAQIADRNVKGLSDFADLCDSAADLMQDSPGLSASLNEITTQDAIVNRLPPTLRHEWFRHQCNVLDVDGPVVFIQLAEWIESQAKILRRESINLAGPIPPTTSVSRTQAPNDNIIVQEKPVSAPSQPAYQPPSLRTPGTSLSKRCGCCKGTAHVTLDCPNLERMSPEDQWTNLIGVCHHCLDSCPPHSFRDCPLIGGKDECQKCLHGYSHHVRMKCNPGSSRSPFGSNNRWK